MIRLLIFVFFAGAIEAHRLPIQVYTTAEGLPRNTATCLVADSKGLLWICTSEGLVRFDGSEFRTFGPQQGISSVMDFRPSAKGGYWLMTESSVCRLSPGSRVGDHCVPLTIEESDTGFQTEALVESADGRIWVERKDAVYRTCHRDPRLCR